MKPWKIALLATPMIVLLLVMGIVGIREVGPWLVDSDPAPDSLDIIFTFAGENARITYSKALFRHYPRSRWFISYPNKKITLPLDKEGLDTTRITVVDTCDNTHSEIDFLARWIEAQPNCESLRIALVSAPYHMRRIRMTMQRRIKACGSTISYLSFPVHYPAIDEERYRHWYVDKTLRPLVVSELQKIAYYWFKY